MAAGRGMMWPSGEEARPERERVYEGEEVRMMLPVGSAVRMEGAAANSGLARALTAAMSLAFDEGWTSRGSERR